ncbi:hypothetical protein CTE05_16860 [Cellulomonas terrae]|uniref:Uncharacterized protein n=1 Tax=Cellulomonas terrae TaxID=311234 RepID=A0A511JJT1_9CELL|nr:hypothetical protein CTE05_16860 [Cellulomonas terrae]
MSSSFLVAAEALTGGDVVVVELGVEPAQLGEPTRGSTGPADSQSISVTVSALTTMCGRDTIARSAPARGSPRCGPTTSARRRISWSGGRRCFQARRPHVLYWIRGRGDRDC